MSAISETKWKGEKIGRMVVLLLLIGSVKIMWPIHDTPQLIVEAATYPLTVSLWLQQAKLTSSDAAADDQFGTAVAVSGDIAVIGIPYDDDAGSFSGSVDVFSREGTNWNHQQKLTAVDATSFDYFGTSVAVSGIQSSSGHLVTMMAAALVARFMSFAVVALFGVNSKAHS
jgi:hypothetical protein